MLVFLRWLLSPPLQTICLSCTYRIYLQRLKRLLYCKANRQVPKYVEPLNLINHIKQQAEGHEGLCSLKGGFFEVGINEPEVGQCVPWIIFIESTQKALGWEGPCRPPSAKPLQGCRPLDQVAQGFVQPDQSGVGAAIWKVPDHGQVVVTWSWCS